MAVSSVKSSLVAQRYASALIDLAMAQNALQPVEQDLLSLETALAAGPEMRQFFQNPRLGQLQQTRAIDGLTSQANFHELTRKFLGVLIENRRLAALPDILIALRAALAARSHVATADVCTAFALSPEQTQALQEKIAQALGQAVTLNVAIDKTLIGGLVVTVGSKQFDDSVKHKLERLERAMNAPANINNIFTQSQKELG